MVSDSRYVLGLTVPGKGPAGNVASVCAWAMPANSNKRDTEKGVRRMFTPCVRFSLNGQYRAAAWRAASQKPTHQNWDKQPLA
jgi:hypothetical protein